MSYVPGCETDVFISYGHVDNQAPTAGWVSALETYVQGRLRQLLDVSVEVWRDPKLDGQDVLWDVLQRRISRSAVFLSVLSPRYARSEACQKEVKWFLQAAGSTGGGLRVGVKSRIARVIKTPYDDPDPIGLDAGETLGHPFYEKTDDGVWEYRSQPGQAYYDQFDRQADRLSQALAGVLRAMRAAAPRNPADTRRRIFLADVTSDRRLDREALANELGRKHDVVSLDPELFGDPALADAVRGVLSTADVSVHLIGRSWGLVPEGAQASVVRLEFDLAREQRERPSFRQIVWVPEDLPEPQDERQKEFVYAILNQQSPMCDERVELIRGGRDRLLQDAEGIIERLARVSDSGNGTGTIRTKTIYVMCDRDDVRQQHLLELRRYLLNQGYPVELPAFESAGIDLAELEEQFILDSQATVIYYGDAPDAWVKMKRRYLLKVLGKSQGGAAHMRAIYLCEPSTELKRLNYLDIRRSDLPESGGFRPLLILGSCEPFAPEQIQPLLNLLEGD